MSQSTPPPKDNQSNDEQPAESLNEKPEPPIDETNDSEDSLEDTAAAKEPTEAEILQEALDNTEAEIMGKFDTQTDSEDQISPDGEVNPPTDLAAPVPDTDEPSADEATDEVLDDTTLVQEAADLPEELAINPDTTDNHDSLAASTDSDGAAPLAEVDAATDEPSMAADAPTSETESPAADLPETDTSSEQSGEAIIEALIQKNQEAEGEEATEAPPSNESPPPESNSEENSSEEDADKGPSIKDKVMGLLAAFFKLLMKPIKWLIKASIVVAILLGILYGIIALFFNPDVLVPEIKEKLANEMGYELELNGPVSWSGFPRLGIEVPSGHLISQTNPTANKQLLAWKRAKLDVDLFLMLKGDWYINRMTVDKLIVTTQGIMPPKIKTSTDTTYLPIKKLDKKIVPVKRWTIGVVNLNDAHLIGVHNDGSPFDLHFDRLKLQQLGFGKMTPFKGAYTYNTGADKHIVQRGDIKGMMQYYPKDERFHLRMSKWEGKFATRSKSEEAFKIKFNTNYYSNPSLVDLEFLTLELGDTDLFLRAKGPVEQGHLKLTGRLDAAKILDTDLSNWFGQFSMTNGQPKVQKVAQISKPSHGAIKSRVIPQVNAWSFNGPVTVKAIQIRDEQIDDLNGEISANNQSIKLKDMRLNWLGKPFNGHMDYRLVAPNTLGLKGHYGEFNMPQLMAHFNQKTLASGNGDLFFDIRLDPNASQYLNTLSGSTELKLSNGRLGQVDLVYWLAKADALIKQRPFSADYLGYTRFDALSTRLDCKEGNCQISDFDLKHPTLAAEAKGTLNLPNQFLNARLLVEKTDGSSDTPLAVKVKGPLSDLKAEPDLDVYVKKILESQLKKQINRAVQSDDAEESDATPKDLIKDPAGTLLKEVVPRLLR